MKLQRIVSELELQVAAGADGLEREVRGGYAGDLLSDVLAHAQKDDVWVTLQTHANVIAVASVKEIAAVIVVQGRLPEAETLAKAEAEGVPVLIAQSSTWDVVGRLHEMGIG